MYCGQLLPPLANEEILGPREYTPITGSPQVESTCTHKQGLFAITLLLPHFSSLPPSLFLETLIPHNGIASLTSEHGDEMRRHIVGTQQIKIYHNSIDDGEKQLHWFLLLTSTRYPQKSRGTSRRQFEILEGKDDPFRLMMALRLEIQEDDLVRRQQQFQASVTTCCKVS